MSEMKFLVIHCSATREGQNITAEDIRRWHTAPAPKGRGWSRVGYSDLILLNGDRHQFVKHDGDRFIDVEEITNGVKGINSIARHVCYIGGMNKDATKAKNTLTEDQKETLLSIIKEVLSYKPDVQIAGHNQFDNKACPSFWVPKFLRENGINESNIYQKDFFKYADKLL
jgi:hypothetical protein